MTRRSIIYSGRARGDLLAIRDYIGEDSPDRAKSWVDAIDKALGRLALYPDSGSSPKDERLAAQGYRIVIIGDYLAFYLARKGRVEVRRVLHGKRRYGHLI